jgi:hypothetical protein
MVEPGTPRSRGRPRKEGDRVAVNSYLRPELAGAVRAYCDRTGKTIAEVIRDALKMLLQADQKN